MMLNARLFVSSFRKPYSLRIFESGEFMTHDGVSLFKGNCFDVLPTLPSSSVQLFLCDLPYGVLNKQNPHASWDKPLDLNHLWYEIKRIGTTNKGFNEVLHHKVNQLKILLVLDFKYLVFNDLRENRLVLGLKALSMT